MAKDLGTNSAPDKASPKNERKKLTEAQRIELLVRCGGRCALCNRYLLEGAMSYREVTFGELAHIIGLQDDARSPRGQDEDLSEDERNDPDNLIFICESEHREIDKSGSRDMFPAEWLRAIKAEHEARIFHLTGLGPQRSTVPIRLLAPVRGKSTEVSREATTRAVIHGAMRFPQFRLSDRHAIEIDLRTIPGEEAAGPGYYQVAAQQIDEVLDHNIRAGLRNGDIEHLSVFAFARLPLLVYLGGRLDDSTPVDVYQRHRSTQDWSWPTTRGGLTFTVGVPPCSDRPSEAVLIVNVTGSIDVDELPEEVGGLPILTIAADAERGADLIDSPARLAAFERACRELTARIESDGYKTVDRLHVFAATGVSTSITLGRVFDPSVHPTLVMYDRGSGSDYSLAMEIGER